MKLSTRRTLTALAATGIGAAAVFAASPAAAADITATSTVTTSINTTGVTKDANGLPQYSPSSRVRMDVAWSVPNGSQAGDTFKVALDDDLAGTSFVPINLTNAAGDVVATTSYDDAGNVVITLTSYVNNRIDVSGTAWFSLGFDQTQVAGVGDHVLSVFGTTVNVHRNAPSGTPSPLGAADYKSGWWNNGEAKDTAVDVNGVLVNTANPQLGWIVQPKVKVGNPAHDWQSATITDTVRSGHHFDCTVVGGKYTKLGLSFTTGGAGVQPGASMTVDSCAPTTLAVRITKNLADQTPYGISYRTWLDTDAAGHPTYVDSNSIQRVGFNPSGYGNSAVINYDGVPYTFSRTVKRVAQGGDATGTNLVPAVDIEKYTGVWAGITGLDANGQPTNQPAGDYDTAPGLQVTDGSATPITMRITNTGNETLDGVTVTDDVFGAAVTGFTCTFNGSTTMPFKGLAPGKSFTCSATLPATFTGTHKDVSTVKAIGRTSKVAVSDKDAFHAVQRTAPTTVTTPTTPQPPAPAPESPAPAPQAPAATPQAPAPAPTVPAVVPNAAVSGAATPATLGITKQALTRRADAGGTVTWRIVVRNTSRNAAQRVNVCDALPRGATLRSRVADVRVAGSAVKAGVTFRGSQACITLNTLAAGARAEWTLVTPLTRTVRGTLTNRAQATAANVRGTVTATAKATVKAAPMAVVAPAVTG